MSDACKNFGEPKQTNKLIHGVCWLSEELEIQVDAVVRAGYHLTASGNDKAGFTAKQEVLCAFFSPTVMWPKRARTPLLCVGY